MINFQNRTYTTRRRFYWLPNVEALSLSMVARIATGVLPENVFRCEGTGFGWRLGVEDDNTLFFRIGRDVADTIVASDTALSTTADVHIGCTWNGGFGAADVRFWMDNVEDTTTLTSAGSGTHGVDSVEINIQTSFLASTARIGRIGVWTRELSAGEIGWLAGRNSPMTIPNGLHLYFPGDDPNKLVDIVQRAETSFVTSAHEIFPNNAESPVGGPPPRSTIWPGNPAPDADTVFVRRRFPTRRMN